MSDAGAVGAGEPSAPVQPRKGWGGLMGCGCSLLIGLVGILVPGVAGLLVYPVGPDRPYVVAGALGAVLAVGTMWLLARKQAEAWREVLAMAIFGSIGAFGLGAGVYLFAVLATCSEPVPRRIEVLNVAPRDTGRRIEYGLDLAPWPPLEEPERVQVSRELYEHYSKASPGSEIVACVAQGPLGTYLEHDWGVPRLEIPMGHPIKR